MSRSQAERKKEVKLRTIEWLDSLKNSSKPPFEWVRDYDAETATLFINGAKIWTMTASGSLVVHSDSKRGGAALSGRPVQPERKPLIEWALLLKKRDDELSRFGEKMHPAEHAVWSWELEQYESLERNGFRPRPAVLYPLASGVDRG